MTVLECKLINEMNKKGVKKETQNGIMSFMKKHKHQKMLMEYLKDHNILETPKLIMKVIEITEGLNF